MGNLQEKFLIKNKKKHKILQNPIGAGVPQMQPLYYAAATSPYPAHAQMPPQQHFIVGPPPAYSNTTAPQYPTGYCPPPAYQAPMFHNVTAAQAQVPPTGYKVPMSAGPQVSFISLFTSIFMFSQQIDDIKHFALLASSPI